MKIGLKSANLAVQSAMPRKFQEGGAMPAPEAGMEEGAPVQEGAPAQEQGAGDPMEMLMQLAQMAMQALQGQDANMAMQVCEGLVQFVQQMQGGAPEEAPAEPVYRRGGTLVRRIRK